MQLLIDEHLTPRIVQWCAERRDPSIYAVHAAHHGLGGRPDEVVWKYAMQHDLVVVTTNASDFLTLLDVELHPGLIVLRESGLSREEQWQRLSAALDFIAAQSEPDKYMVNKVIEVVSPHEITGREVPWFDKQAGPAE